MQASQIPYEKTGKFSSLVSDFLAQNQPLKRFFCHWADDTGFQAQLGLKADFAQENRDVLVQQLRKQYSSLNLMGEEAETIEN